MGPIELRRTSAEDARGSDTPFHGLWWAWFRCFFSQSPVTYWRWQTHDHGGSSRKIFVICQLPDIWYRDRPQHWPCKVGASIMNRFHDESQTLKMYQHQPNSWSILTLVSGRLGSAIPWFNIGSSTSEFQCWYLCEWQSPCLFYHSFNFDFCVWCITLIHLWAGNHPRKPNN